MRKWDDSFRYWLLYVAMIGFVTGMTWPLLVKMVYWVTFWSFGWLLVLIMIGPLFFFAYRSRWLARRVQARIVRSEWVWRRSLQTIVACASLMMLLGGIGLPGWIGGLRIGGEPVILMMQVVLLTLLINAPYLLASWDQAADRDRKYAEEDSQGNSDSK